MKAVINEKETPVKYPWIGESKDSPGFIVAFWSIDRATALTSSGDYVVGSDYSENLRRFINKFTPFTGTITLSND